MSREKPAQAAQSVPLAYIHAAGGIGHKLGPDQPPPSLRAQAKQRFGPSLRQASRFIELALLGVDECLKSWPAMGTSGASDTSAMPIYVATGLGEVQKTMSLFATVTGAIPEPAAPFDFINAANNTAAFYIAKHFTGPGRNFTICDGDLSFESALQLALLECRRKDAQFVLVGGVDEAIASRSEYLRRYASADASGTMGEGSYWFLLSSSADGAIAEVLHADIFSGHPGEHIDVNTWAVGVAQALRAYVATAPVNGTLHLLPGAGLDEPLTVALTRQWERHIRIKNNSIKSNSYPTAVTRTVSDWLTHSGDGEQASDCAAHVSRDSQGRTAVTLIQKSRR
jgi:hypothetical protein